MNVAAGCQRGSCLSLDGASLPDRGSLIGSVSSGSAAEPAVVPTKEPEVVPATPDVEPNTIPYRDPVPEPAVTPTEHPDTSCPVRR